MMQLEKWCDLPLRAEGIAFAAIAALPLSLLCGAGYFIATRVSAADARVNHSFQVLQEVQRLETGESHASAQLHAFLLTRQENFADSLRHSIAAWDSSRRKLLLLAGDDPAQMQTLWQAAGMQRSRVEHISSLMARFRAESIATPQLQSALLAAEEERLRMESFIGALQQHEGRLLKVRLQQAKRLRSALQATAALGIFSGLGAGVLLWILFEAGIASRLLRVRDNLAKLPSGVPVERPQRPATKSAPSAKRCSAPPTHSATRPACSRAPPMASLSATPLADTYSSTRPTRNWRAFPSTIRR
ncbi:MAG: CHASE3 domain-containing protein [Acidobacteriia bacterium]|nr:CHASE3 domain-containing protein [Terriglobia bacterium]